MSFLLDTDICSAHIKQRGGLTADPDFASTWLEPQSFMVTLEKLVFDHPSIDASGLHEVTCVSGTRPNILGS